jgi:hypothetical protein
MSLRTELRILDSSGEKSLFDARELKIISGERKA